MTVQLFTPAVEVAVAITMTPSAVEHVRKQLGKKTGSSRHPPSH